MVRVHSGLPLMLLNLLGSKRQSFRVVSVPAIICHQTRKFFDNR
jgi:hypothetical protein